MNTVSNVTEPRLLNAQITEDEIIAHHRGWTNDQRSNNLVVAFGLPDLCRK
jgi:hypothetical protein